MQMPELYILRHGETEWNAQNRMQGWANSPLTEQGRAQAARQGDILAERDLSGFEVYCSPTGRAIQTAAIALAPFVDEIHTDPRLREVGVGDWTGRKRDELPIGDGPDAFLEQYEAAPGGEGLAALRARCAAFLADLQAPAVLITHGITSRMLRTLVIGEAAVGLSNVHGGQGCVYHLRKGIQTVLR